MNLTTSSQKLKSKLNNLLLECNFQSNKHSYLNGNIETINNKTPYKVKSSNQSFYTISSQKFKQKLENIKFDFLSKDEDLSNSRINVNDLYLMSSKYDDCNKNSISRSIVNSNERSFSNISKGSKGIYNIKHKKDNDGLKEIFDDDYKNRFKPRKIQTENFFQKKKFLLEDNRSLNTLNKSIFQRENIQKEGISYEEDGFFSSKPSQNTKIQREFQRLNNLLREFEKKEGKDEICNGNLLTRQSRISKNQVNDFNPYLSLSKDYQHRLLSRSKNKIIK